MRIARLVVISVVALAASGAAEASWVGQGSKQPKAISLVNRARTWEANRLSHSMREFKYNRSNWGLSNQIVGNRPNHLQPYIRGY